MMKRYRVAINGFGRIGRTFFRSLIHCEEIEVVAINDIAPPETLIHLLKYDSTHGKLMDSLLCESNHCQVGVQQFQFMQEKGTEYPWLKLDVDLVVDCTGIFKTKEQLQVHIDRGAKRVLLSAPSDDELPMWVRGVNDEAYSWWNESIISCASCTTNNAAPMIHVIEKSLGIESAYISTVHSYTGDQRLHDAPHKDLRRARGAVQSIVPTTTGAAKALTRIFPTLGEQLGGCGIRVPVPNGSLSDITFMVKRTTTVEEVNQLFQSYADSFPSILEYSEEPLVSKDILGNKHSCVFDSELTSVIGRMVKIVGWYDNEVGYSNRLKDATLYFASNR